MKENRGHAECIAYGLGHIIDNENFDKVILMDGDGEDRPEEIEDLLDKAFPSTDISVVVKELKDQRSSFHNSLSLHKLLTLIFTGKKLILVILAVYQKRYIKDKKQIFPLE